MHTNNKRDNFARIAVTLLSSLVLSNCTHKGKDIPLLDISSWHLPGFTRTYDDYMAASYKAVNEGNSEEALSMYRKAVESAQSEYGYQDLRIATSASYLAAYCVSLGLLGEAEINYKKAYNLDYKVLGPNDPETIRVRNALADVLVKVFKLDEAKKLLQSSGLSSSAKK